MIEQKITTEFKLVSKTLAVHPNGTEVELPNRDDLIYRKGGKEISLRIDFDFISEVLFTTHVYLPNEPKWNSGKVLNDSEINELKIDIRDGLVAFDSIVLFKTQAWVNEALAEITKEA